MKRRLVMACALLAAPAWGTPPGSIVSSFRSPCTGSAYGVDYHGGYLYHADGGSRRVFYVTNTAGSVVATIPDLTAAVGIDRTDAEFWTSNYSGWVSRVSTNGSTIRRFRIPGQVRGYGITYGNGYLWCDTAPGSTRRVYQFTTYGSVASSFTPPGAAAGGLCWDAPHLWYADSLNPTGLIYRITTSGSVVTSINVPGARPRGITRQGPYLWYTDFNKSWVYQITIGFTAARPASLGRVKALYR